MSRARIECYSSNNGKYLNDGDCFEEELLKNFIYWAKQKSNEEWHVVLTKELESRNGERHVQDILNDVFDRNVDLDFEFAKELKLYDMIMSDCLMPKSDLGKAIIELCSHSDLIFIVTRKWYMKTDSFDIEFEVCHLDNNRECFNDIITNKILE